MCINVSLICCSNYLNLIGNSKSQQFWLLFQFKRKSVKIHLLVEIGYTENRDWNFEEILMHTKSTFIYFFFFSFKILFLEIKFGAGIFFMFPFKTYIRFLFYASYVRANILIWFNNIYYLLRFPITDLFSRI